jgi:hypothetical protein
MGRILRIAALLLVSGVALSVPAQAKSSGEVAVGSRLMTVKYEACRQEAKRQHLHLLARYRFLRKCHLQP